MRPHEPECQHYVDDVDESEKVRTGACIFCGIARAAYRRGREDAAKALETALGDYLYGEEYGLPEFRLVAAARGEETSHE